MSICHRLRTKSAQGPFKLKEIVSGQHITWERNPHYYDSRYPYIDGVKQIVVADPFRRFLAAQRGDVLLWHTYPGDVT